MTLLYPPPLCARPELPESTFRHEWDYVPLAKRTSITEQSWPEGTRPLVSILCTTYNQERTIRHAIEGFLMQETTFPVQIFVHDDASTDNTASIIREYESLHPCLFLVVLQPQNLFSRRITRQVDHLLFGRFIAYCEGDDYWTHPWKLQLQCAYMLKNPDVSLVYHPVLALDDANNPLNDHTRAPGLGSHFESFIRHGNFIHTPSVLRINHGFPLPPEAAASPAGDFFHWLLALEQGRMYMMPITMAVYRWGPGIWSSLSATQVTLKTITIFFAAREYCFRKGFLAECEILEARIRRECKSVYLHVSDEQLYAWSSIGPSSAALVSGFLMQAIGSMRNQAEMRSRILRFKAKAKKLLQYMCVRLQE